MLLRSWDWAYRYPITEFREQDLTGACLEHIRLRGATFTQVSVRRARQATVHDVMALLTEEHLASNVARTRAWVAPDRELSFEGMPQRGPQRGMGAPALCRRDLSVLETQD